MVEETEYRVRALEITGEGLNREGFQKGWSG